MSPVYRRGMGEEWETTFFPDEFPYPGYAYSIQKSVRYAIVFICKTALTQPFWMARKQVFSREQNQSLVTVYRRGVAGYMPHRTSPFPQWTVAGNPPTLRKNYTDGAA